MGHQKNSAFAVQEVSPLCWTATISLEQEQQPVDFVYRGVLLLIRRWPVWSKTHERAREIEQSKSARARALYGFIQILFVNDKSSQVKFLLSTSTQIQNS